MKAGSLVPVGILVASSVLWGLVWWPLKHVHGLGIEGLPLIAIGHVGVTLLLLPFLLRQFPLWRGAWRWMLAIALVGGAANVTFNTALVYGDVVRAMVLFYLLPVWGVLGGRIFLKERIDAQRLISMVLALAGALVMLGASREMLQQFSRTDAVALLSGFLFAMNNILFRVTATVPVVSKITALFAGGLVLAAFPLATGITAMPTLNTDVIVAALAIGVGWWLIATLGTQWAVTRLEAGRASVIMVMELVTAILSAAMIEDKSLQPREWVGVVCVLLATLIEAWRPPTPADSGTERV